jgi:hypothetical protein
LPGHQTKSRKKCANNTTKRKIKQKNASTTHNQCTPFKKMPAINVSNVSATIALNTTFAAPSIKTSIPSIKTSICILYYHTFLTVATFILDNMLFYSDTMQNKNKPPYPDDKQDQPSCLQRLIKKIGQISQKEQNMPFFYAVDECRILFKSIRQQISYNIPKRLFKFPSVIFMFKNFSRRS